MHPTPPALSIEADAYRAFSRRVRLDIRPLTVVFGPNGSGKSALLRLPHLLSAALRPGSDAGPGLPYGSGPLESSASLLDFAHQGDEPSDGFEVGLDVADAQLRVRIGRRYASTATRPDQWIETWALRTAATATEITWRPLQRQYQCAQGVIVGFRGLLPILENEGGGVDVKAVSEMAPRVDHIGPRRDPGDSRFVPSVARPVRFVGFSGAQTCSLIESLHNDGAQTILDEITQRCLELLDVELRINPVGDPTPGIAVQGRMRGKRHNSALDGLGTGFSHAFPILVQSVVARHNAQPPQRPGLLVVEEPESHLHTDLQARLADLFLDTARAGRQSTLIETHSEALVLRLRRRVAEQPDLGSLISLVWVDTEGEATRIVPLEIASDGSVPDWPEGWFDTALFESREIMRARRAHHRP